MKSYILQNIGLLRVVSEKTTENDLKTRFKQIASYSNEKARECLQGEAIFENLTGPLYGGEDNDGSKIIVYQFQSVKKFEDDTLRKI